MWEKSGNGLTKYVGFLKSEKESNETEQERNIRKGLRKQNVRRSMESMETK